MRVVNEPLLATMRTPGECAYCRRKVKRREPHHVFTTGATRIDAPFTCLPLCSVFSGGLNCHAAAHQGTIARADLELMLAERNNCSQDDVRCAVYFLRRMPKSASPEVIEFALDELAAGAVKLVRAALSGCELGRGKGKYRWAKRKVRPAWMKKPNRGLA